VLATMGPTRALLKKVLPAPGEGPSKEERESGFFVVKLVGIGEGPDDLIPFDAASFVDALFD